MYSDVSLSSNISQNVCFFTREVICSSFGRYLTYNFLFQALKMSYVSNKPYPTPGHLLPMPNTLVDVIKEPNVKLGQKRKLMDSEGGELAMLIVKQK